jgi:hypothetical protein
MSCTRISAAFPGVTSGIFAAFPGVTVGIFAAFPGATEGIFGALPGATEFSIFLGHILASVSVPFRPIPALMHKNFITS